jgi:hypothetical protein
MILMPTTLFAIKDAIDLKLTKQGESSVFTTIDYLNDIQIQMDSEQVYATRKGDNYISFSSGRTGTLTMNCEVINKQFLTMMLGGTMGADGTITVTGAVPNQAYTAEGTFKVTSLNGDMYKQIKFYNLKAQVSADLTLSASEVSAFTLVLDILADGQGKIMDIVDLASAPGTGGTAGVSEPQVVSIIKGEEE